MVIGLLAVLAACVGNMLTLHLTRQGLALIPVLAWAMGYGAVFLIGMAGVTGIGWTFDWHMPYVLSWLYLTVFGTVIAFVMYFKLAQREGPARAALMGVVIPVIALGVSAAAGGLAARRLCRSLGGMILCVGSVVMAQRLGASKT